MGYNLETLTTLHNALTVKVLYWANSTLDEGLQIVSQHENLLSAGSGTDEAVEAGRAVPLIYKMI